MLDVADDMGVGFEHDLAAANGALDPPVDDDAVGLNPADDRGLGRDDERGAMQIPLDMAVDLDEALGGDGTYDLQSFGNDGGATPEQPEHDDPLTRYARRATGPPLPLIHVAEKGHEPGFGEVREGELARLGNVPSRGRPSGAGFRGNPH